MDQDDRVVRYYLILSKPFENMFGSQYLTFSCKRSKQPYLRSNNSILNMVASSDIVIIADDERAWYAKHRYENHTTAKIDPDEFAWIKLSSMEIDLA